jgi:hypothetical protein
MRVRSRRRAADVTGSPEAPALEPDVAATAPRPPDPALVAERERLTERFTVMQAELGGLFYEMAIRDHVRMEVLMPKAAALQRVDAELAQVEHLLAGGDRGIGGHCPACGAVYAAGAAFCSQCAGALAG